MAYEITEYDKKLVCQTIVKFRVKIEVLEFDTDIPISSIEGGIVSGSSSIDAESDIRRTFSLTVTPLSQSGLIISEEGIIWLNKKIRLSIGIEDAKTGEYTYWKQGIYVFMNSSATYDAENNEIQLECSDMMAYLDGSRNGNLGQNEIDYPAYDVSFDEFNDTITYYKGEMAIHDDDPALYICNTDKFKGEFSTTYWKKRVAAYDSQSAYKVGAKAFYAGSIYKCKKKISSTTSTTRTFNPKQWELVESAGEPRKYYYIRDQLITAITQLGRVKKYQIDWIGEAKAQPHYSTGWDYEAYRESTLLEATDGNKYYQCFAMPYDLEFSTGTTVSEIITEMRDLYENYEAYFDEDGVFICKLIPSGDDDETTFTNDFIKKILISENTDIDFTEVKNVTEAWGKTYDPDWYANESTYSSSTYSASIDGYTDDDHLTYYNNDELAIRVCSSEIKAYTETRTVPGSKILYDFEVKEGSNPSPCYIQISCVESDTKTTKLDAIPVYDENTDDYLAAGIMQADDVYAFKIQKKIVDDEEQTRAYFLGNWQAHAMDVLTDGTVGEEYTATSGKTVKVNSVEFFEEVYNCKNVHFTVIPDSPFTVQKLGVILNVYENEDMISDTLAIEGAIQENYRTCRLTDSIEITTKLCPFADVNIKITYQRADKDKPEEYLVKNISHDWSGGTTTWKLVKYYRQYIDTDV